MTSPHPDPANTPFTADDPAFQAAQTLNRQLDPFAPPGKPALSLTEQEYRHRLQVLTARYGATWVQRLLEAHDEYRVPRIYSD